MFPSRLIIFNSLLLGFSYGIHAGEPPDWDRRDPVKAAAVADVIVIAKIRNVSVLSGKTGRPLKKLPEWVDERYQGQRLQLILEHPRVLWPVGVSIRDELIISWDGITTAYVTGNTNSTVVLLLAKSPTAKSTIYTPARYWPFADTSDLQAIQRVISVRAASTKPK